MQSDTPTAAAVEGTHSDFDFDERAKEYGLLTLSEIEQRNKETAEYNRGFESSIKPRPPLFGRTKRARLKIDENTTWVPYHSRLY